jgi:hypothetical protein
MADTQDRKTPDIYLCINWYFRRNPGVIFGEISNTEEILQMDDSLSNIEIDTI